jgi:hypothetical protein
MAGAGRASLAPKSRGREHEGRPGCEKGEARPPRQEFPGAGGGVKPVSRSSQMVQAVGSRPPPPTVACKGVPCVAH